MWFIGVADKSTQFIALVALVQCIKEKGGQLFAIFDIFLTTTTTTNDRTDTLPLAYVLGISKVALIIAYQSLS